MNDTDLFKPTTASLQDTITELKALTGDDDFEAWKSVHEVYHYDKENTTLKQLNDMKNALEKRQREAVFNLVRHVYLFWRRMFDWGPDAIGTANHYTCGFDGIDSKTDLVQYLVRTKEHPAFPWDWEHAVWQVENRDKDLYGHRLKESQEYLTCHVTCWVRDHDDDWEFSIPVKFLDPAYDFEADKEFMDMRDQIRFNGLYSALFRLHSMEMQRAIIKLLPRKVIDSILSATGRKIPQGYESLIEE